jgi:DNA-binding Lrp family transcriptional regulator
MKAWILIHSEGEPADLARRLKAVPGVAEADAITGPYDVIASCEADDLRSLAESITRIQTLEGVLKTTTRVVISPTAEVPALARAA